MEEVKFIGIDTRTTKSGKCKVCYNWFVQVVVWLSILYTYLHVESLTSLFDRHLFLFITLCFIYLNYIILETCCSKTFFFLKNKHKTDTLSSYMDIVFSSPPRIDFLMEHYNEEAYWENGRLKTRKRTSGFSSGTFTYNSFKDLSNNLVIDVYSTKNYIKLYIDLKVKAYDQASQLDFLYQRERFISKNRLKDLFYEFSQWSRIEELSRYNLVKIKDEEPLFIGLSFYLIFVFIFPCVELYKIYFNRYCYEQDFTIVKEISTREMIGIPMLAPDAINIEATPLTLIDNSSTTGNTEETLSIVAADEEIESQKIIMPTTEIIGEAEMKEHLSNVANTNKDVIKPKKK